MSQEKTKTPLGIWIATGFLVLLGSFYLGRHIGKDLDPPAIDTHKIDSLNNIILTLEDSVKLVKGRTDTLTKVIYKYRTRYDSVYLRSDSKQIVESLKKTASKPIK